MIEEACSLVFEVLEKFSPVLGDHFGSVFFDIAFFQKNFFAVPSTYFPFLLSLKLFANSPGLNFLPAVTVQTALLYGFHASFILDLRHDCTNGRLMQFLL